MLYPRYVSVSSFLQGCVAKRSEWTTPEVGDTGYRYLDHTADVMIEAYGKSIDEAFSFAAKAMFSVMLDPLRVDPYVCTKIEVSARDLEGLLYSWLEELLFRFEVEKMAYSEFRFDIVEMDGIVRGTGEACGEIYSPRKHGRRTEVKAITYAQMSITQSGDGSRVRFILDI